VPAGALSTRRRRMQMVCVQYYRAEDAGAFDFVLNDMRPLTEESRTQQFMPTATPRSVDMTAPRDSREAHQIARPL